jgi:hypothetical protein
MVFVLWKLRLGEDHSKVWIGVYKKFSKKRCWSLFWKLIGVKVLFKTVSSELIREKSLTN